MHFTYNDILARDLILKAARSLAGTELYRVAQEDRNLFRHLIHYVYYAYVETFWDEEDDRIARLRLLIDRYCADVVGEGRITCDMEESSYLFFGPISEDDVSDAEILAQKILYSTRTEITKENINAILEPLAQFFGDCLLILGRGIEQDLSEEEVD